MMSSIGIAPALVDQLQVDPEQVGAPADDLVEVDDVAALGNPVGLDVDLVCGARAGCSAAR